ncbi:MAG TPA: hypothetical protein VFC07_04425, partial [Verrucomicrobiae bacterium]|nr:hypothetical protein [Verrucomicrobiae bacterium]
ELVNAALRHNPLEHMSIPALPALAAAPDAKPGGPGTNSSPAKAVEKPGTNAVAAAAAGKPGTNSIAAPGTELKGTNAVSNLVSIKPETNAAPPPEPGVKSTNSAPMQAVAKLETNTAAGQELEKKGTNAIAGTNLVSGTNSALGTNITSGTNAALRAALGRKAMELNLRQGPGKQAAELPPVIQARVDKVVDSEILGPVIRPVPMGLLGIAGEYAFLRAPSGQTEMVKEGAEMGGIKLLKIGINRVLVEEAGEKKELSIFEGYGGETLLPKPTDKTNEIITKPK